MGKTWYAISPPLVTVTALGEKNRSGQQKNIFVTQKIPPDVSEILHAPSAYFPPLYKLGKTERGSVRPHQPSQVFKGLMLALQTRKLHGENVRRMLASQPAAVSVFLCVGSLGVWSRGLLEETKKEFRHNHARPSPSLPLSAPALTKTRVRNLPNVDDLTH